MYNRSAFNPLGMTLPAFDIYEGGECCVKVPRSAFKIILSALDGYRYNGSWEGTPEEINTTISQINKMLVVMMECRRCTSEPANGNDTCTSCGGGAGGAGGYGEECLMAGFITDITCEDGVLTKWWGKCCSEPIDCAAGEVTNPPPIDPPPIDPVAGYGCNKAAGIAGILGPDIQAIAETLPQFVVNWRPQSIAHFYPQYPMNYEQRKAIADAYELGHDEIDLLVDDTEFVEKLACVWVDALDDTDNLTEEEYFRMQAVLGGQFTAQQTAFIQTILSGLGFSLFKWWAQAFYDEAATCDCPSGPPLAGSIWFDGTYQGPQGGDMVVGQFDVLDSGRRIQVQLACAGAGDKHFTDFEPNFAGAVSGDTIKVRIYPTPGHQYSRVPANVPGLVTSTINESQWCEHYIDASPGGQTRFEASGYIEKEQNIDAANLPQWIDIQGWKYPITDAGTVRFNWIMEIVEINGLDLIPIGP